jgi:hypothetical protein
MSGRPPFPHIFGVDFSGAKLAGQNTWIAHVELAPGRRPRVRDLQSLESLCGSPDRETSSYNTLPSNPSTGARSCATPAPTPSTPCWPPWLPPSAGTTTTILPSPAPRREGHVYT